MRKYLLLLSMASFVQLLSAQTVDSITFRQLDSLINVSRDLALSKDFDQAIAVVRPLLNP